MDRQKDSSPSLDRRTLLGSAAGLAAGFPAAAASGASIDTSAVSVMTWNVFLGVSLSDLSDVRTITGLRETVGDLMEEAEDHPYEARSDAIAAEIDAADPDVVALQEAARITKRDTDAEAEAEIEVADLLDLIVSALNDRGRDYEVAVSSTSTAVELTGETDDGEYDVGLTDRDALLVRSDLETAETESGTYDASIFRGLIVLERSYCTARIDAETGEYTVACTHLESRDSSIRRRQAAELLDIVPSDGPVVLAGDFNSGPGTSTGTYDLLTESFEDAHATRRPDEGGDTCCQAISLKNDRSGLSERVDGVLYRDGPEATAVERVAADPGERFDLEEADETVEMWPSDHAAVLATLALPENSSTAAAGTRTPITTRTSTATSSSTETATSSSTETATPSSTETATPKPTSDGPSTETAQTSPTTGGVDATSTANAGTDEETGSDAGTNSDGRTGTEGEPGIESETRSGSTDAGDATGSAPAGTDSGARSDPTAATEEGPGFGALAAVAGATGGLLARWRRD